MTASPSFGRYTLLGEIASGGLATLYLARFSGELGFSRTVAIKELRPAFARDPAFVAMLADEARVGAHVRHPNVVAALDVVVHEEATLLVLEYVHGEALSRLLETTAERGEPVPVPVAVAILGGALRGLHAAHEARDAQGRSLEIVHRDLSPQNVLVGIDGVARVADFGIATARGRVSKTETGVLKGKPSYVAPEQVHGATSRRSDLFSIATVAWETLAGERLFTGATPNAVLGTVLAGKIRQLTIVRPDVPASIAAVVHQGLARDPARRPASALDMAERLEAALAPASVVEVGDWVSSLAGPTIEVRAALLAKNASAIARPIESTALVTETLRLTPPAAASWSWRRSGSLGALGALGAALITVALVASRARHTANPVPAEAHPGPSLAADSRVEPAPVPGLPVEPEGAASSPALASSGAEAPPSSVAPPARHLPRAPPGHCNPPYALDAFGHIKYKRECLVR